LAGAASVNECNIGEISNLTLWPLPRGSVPISSVRKYFDSEEVRSALRVEESLQSCRFSLAVSAVSSFVPV
jgi:hypothetical protein